MYVSNGSSREPVTTQSFCLARAFLACMGGFPLRHPPSVCFPGAVPCNLRLSAISARISFRMEYRSFILCRFASSHQIVPIGSQFLLPLHPSLLQSLCALGAIGQIIKKLKDICQLSTHQVDTHRSRRKIRLVAKRVVKLVYEAVDGKKPLFGSPRCFVVSDVGSKCPCCSSRVELLALVAKGVLPPT